MTLRLISGGSFFALFTRGIEYFMILAFVALMTSFVFCEIIDPRYLYDLMIG
jgi:hypothetical protein